MTDEELLAKAEEASERSYSPYSHFRVGAALLCESGKVYQGCNIENVSYGASVCAERTAVFKAVSEGERSFLKIAVFSLDSDDCSPCGICRQVLSEFSPEMTVVYRRRGVIVSKALKELLHDAFCL